MKIFAVRDEMADEIKDLAYLIYYEKSKKFYIELPDNADPWETPLILDTFVLRGCPSVNSYMSRLWVQQRIIPPDRQNLGEILKRYALDSYDEYTFLTLAEGRCAQDSYYIVEIKELPLEIQKRGKYKVKDIIPLDNCCILASFKNGCVKRIDIAKIVGNNRRFAPILANEKIFKLVSIQPGGYGITWGENLDISDYDLFNNGYSIGLKANELEHIMHIISKQLMSSAELAEFLGCSRQNINDLVRRGKLHPVKQTSRSKLFLKSEILEKFRDY